MDVRDGRDIVLPRRRRHADQKDARQCAPRAQAHNRHFCDRATDSKEVETDWFVGGSEEIGEKERGRGKNERSVPHVACD